MTNWETVNYPAIIDRHIEAMFEDVAIALSLETGDVAPDTAIILEEAKARLTQVLITYARNNSGEEADDDEPEEPYPEEPRDEPSPGFYHNEDGWHQY